MLVQVSGDHFDPGQVAQQPLYTQMNISTGEGDAENLWELILILTQTQDVSQSLL